MSDDAPERHGYHAAPSEGHAFDDAGEHVAIDGPKAHVLEAYCPQCEHAVDAVCPKCKTNVEGEGHQSNPGRIEALRHGLLVALEDGHTDGTRLRVVALCRLSGFFKSDTDAAQSIGVHPSTVHRAVKRLGQKIESALCKRSTTEKFNN